MVISDKQMGHPCACCSKWATHDAQNRWCPHGTNASRASRCSMRQTSHISCGSSGSSGRVDYSAWPTNVLIGYRALIVHKNTVGGELWCSYLSTHAFLLGNGQTYATLGVPYYCVSRIFMSRSFHPCKLLPHFHVPQVHVSHFQRPRLRQAGRKNVSARVPTHTQTYARTAGRTTRKLLAQSIGLVAEAYWATLFISEW